MCVCLCTHGGGDNTETRQQHAAPPSNPKVPHMNESGWSEQVGGLDREPIVKRRLGRGDTKQKPVINGTTATPLLQQKIRDVGTRATEITKQQKIFLSVTVGISCNFFFLFWFERKKKKGEISTRSVGSENKGDAKAQRGQCAREEKEISLGSFPSFHEYSMIYGDRWECSMQFNTCT